MAHIKSIKKIYSDGRHNAFTDIEYWKGRYYVTFRNANGHARPGPVEAQGNIIVIRSQDLREWEVCARIVTEGDERDDRDPHLVDMGSELGVFFCTSKPKEPGKLLHKEGSMSTFQSHAAFTMNGVDWSSPQVVSEIDTWLCQVEHHKGTFYCAAFNREGRFKLTSSPKGRRWETISEIPPEEFKSTEVGIWITNDEVMHFVDRAWEDPDMALLGQSSPPYKEWKIKKLRYTVHCPVLRPVGDELWVAGKTITTQFPQSVEIPPEPSPEKIASLTRRDERLAKTPQDWHTAIWRLVGDRLEPILVLPSRGDCGYPGLVVEEDRVLMSFYSQHDVDEGPTPKSGEHASEIYLAEIGV